MSRISAPLLHELSPEQRNVYDNIATGPRGIVRGPVALWLHSHELASRAQALGAFCRFNSSLPARLCELAILVTAQYWQASYEWTGHAPLARAAGLSDPVIEAVRIGQRPSFRSEDEEAVYGFSVELLRNHDISPSTWEHAHAVLGTRGTVDLVGILGYYALISMTIQAFHIHQPVGEPKPFPGGREPFPI